MAVTIDRNEQAYLDWLEAHPNGFVLNTPRSTPPDYMVLHRVSCPSISQYTNMAQPGGFTERDYIKVCGESIEELRAWLRDHGRADGTFSSECTMCKPS